jgi:hypothetical protein
LAGRAYEDDKRDPDPELAAVVRGLDQGFIHRRSPVLNAVCLELIEERKSAPWLVDTDVIEAFKSLTATMKTLASGIYYETLPESAIQASLCRRLRILFDELMQPQNSADSLKVSDVIEILHFLTVSATVNANSRPRSRQYLDLLNSLAEQAEPERRTGSLILP